MPSSRELSFRILRHTLVYKWPLVASIVSLAVVAATEASFSWLIQPLIDFNFGSKTEGLPSIGKLLPIDMTQHWPLWGVPVALLAVAFLRFIANYVNAYASSWLAARVQHDLRSLMFARLMRLPVATYDQESAGVLLSRVVNDVGAITQANTQVLTVLFKDSLTVLFLLISLFLIDWQLTLFCFAVIPGIAICVSLMGKRMRRLSLFGQSAIAELVRILDESLGGQRIVKVFGAQRYEEERFDRAAKHVRHTVVKLETTSALNSGVVMLIVAIVLAAIIYFASLRSQADALTAGAFIAFIMLMMQLQQPIKNLTKVNEQIQRGLAAAETVFGLIDRPVEPDNGKHTVVRARGEIRFEQVRFRYGQSERWALDGIDLTIAPGEVIALVGSSGGGKTTLATLLPRFYDPLEGRLQLDGVDLRDYQLPSLRQQIALVSQDVMLFNDSLAANIAYGSGESIDMARVEAAAKAAYAADFIEAMPNSYQTQIGENGVRLSGGQRQRLAIARALYKDAPILILDEATSALDSESERQVQAALDVLMKGRTTVIIAHRLSTIENADRIVAMQNGKIAEIGNHRELLARGGVYAKLYFNQPEQSQA
ncbi:lipid A export permease/ATP-binding protein MsbA [Chitinimonas sp. BJB300]|uniref:lipid A export permease/ATP-binding protein MsbA n=1 Tax=Chitinimonas sp. BJB300 TaxID=1559339 RepID=UPI000C1089F8|nr:lipid A export permease/ATP-binding protein MsbA [Chitinimonas sp. BJB300]PHV11416.1 lipid A export permease/ATP-binding protein MsbA [Chitinimonas sp. BJB300]TSJ91014.1 lipid A export permease/ATP-binding protein MsbA [Chitinimonas sp. BJB300]